MNDSLVLMALMTGFLGFGHCLGMCGGLVTALSLSDAGKKGGLIFHCLYNLGRISTYTFIGAVVGGLGSALAYTDKFKFVTRTLLLSSDVFVIVIGLGTAGAFAWLNVAKLDFPGPMALMTKAVKGLEPFPASIKALPLGLMFGFLPCGYLYAVAITAAQSASISVGASMLFAFGIGTLPSLIFVGSMTHWLSIKARTWMLRLAGAVVACMGLINLIKHLRMMGYLM